MRAAWQCRDLLIVFQRGCLAILSVVLMQATASEIDIAGPAGSVSFGWVVTVLPNGNIVVQDPDAYSGSLENAGAVYLYAPDGTLISTLHGGSAEDWVGEDPVIVLPSGDFLVTSYFWRNGDASSAGAVTWVSGEHGLDGVVSADNSLVGSTSNDQVGSSITVLANGNYVVASPNWTNGSASQAGAVTLVPADGSLHGAVSAANSLVGSNTYDWVGEGVLALTNGNYLVTSPHWDNGTMSDAGAITWTSGSVGVVGSVTAQNSLVGGTASDLLGFYDFGMPSSFALANGNAVVLSPFWDNGDVVDAGAATWIDGAMGLTGVLSQTNSLVGTTTGDAIGGAGVFEGFSELRGDRYAILSPAWSSPVGAHIGAITWADSATGIAGTISSSNSLIGSSTDDLAFAKVTTLANGNWIVAAPRWSNGDAAGAGAVTWIQAGDPLTGTISITNSLVGTTAGDSVGWSVAPLTNGNYVVQTPFWSNGGSVMNAGAATWVDGSAPSAGVVTAENSLIGTSANDEVGSNTGGVGPGVVALANGNYVVLSFSWSNGPLALAGAATWGSGSGGIAGPVSTENSLVGDQHGDGVGLFATPLANGNVVVSSLYWHDGMGAATWMDGTTGLVGAVSADNSLVGRMPGDEVCGVTQSDVSGNYFVFGRDWSYSDSASEAGAVAWGDGRLPLTGEVTPSNALVGTHYLESVGDSVTAVGNNSVVITSEDSVTLARGNSRLSGPPNADNSVLVKSTHTGVPTIAYDARRDRLVVGWFRAGYVAIFQTETLFANGFD
jgi:uncharacterized protein DUF5650